MPSPRPIRFCLVDADRPARERSLALLARQPALTCVGTYATVEEAVRAAPQTRPDVAVVEIVGQGNAVIGELARLRVTVPALQVLVVTTCDDAQVIFDCLRAGATGYLLKNAVGPDLATAVEQVHAGGSPISLRVARKIVTSFHGQPPGERVGRLDRLTPREVEMLALLAEGRLYKEIAERLGVSYNTVRAHLRNIYKKLHVRSRGQATLAFLNRTGTNSADAARGRNDRRAACPA